MNDKMKVPLQPLSIDSCPFMARYCTWLPEDIFSPLCMVSPLDATRNCILTILSHFTEKIQWLKLYNRKPLYLQDG